MSNKATLAAGSGADKESEVTKAADEVIAAADTGKAGGEDPSLFGTPMLGSLSTRTGEIEC